MTEKQKTGAEGESKGVEYFRSIGYEIMDTNWRYGNLEIDIIAKDKIYLVVAEVKTRSSNYYGEPEIFVNKQKQRNLINAAGAYLAKNSLYLEVRFDIVSILKNGEKFKINHIKNAFYPLIK